MLVYMNTKSIAVHEEQKEAVKPYQKIIAGLPAEQATLSALHSVADDIGWISAIKVGHYKKGAAGVRGLDFKQYAALSSDRRFDSLVGVNPSLELTRGLEKVLLVVTVWVQKDTIYGPAIASRRVITESVPLGKAGPPLSVNQLKQVHSADPRVAVPARARIWFAHGGHRLKNAMLFDLSIFSQNLRKYLAARGPRR